MVEHFDSFWALWPDNGSDRYEEYSRKKDKKKCAELWGKQKLDQQWAVISRDVEQRKKYDKGWLGQRGAFLAAPLVYLRNERWNDGAFADTRKDRPKYVPNSTPIGPIGVEPDLSKYARCANRIMLHLSYFDERRGMRPLGAEMLQKMLQAKRELVEIGELEQMEDQEFVDMVFEGLGNLLGLRQAA